MDKMAIVRFLVDGSQKWNKYVRSPPLAVAIPLLVAIAAVLVIEKTFLAVIGVIAIGSYIDTILSYTKWVTNYRAKDRLNNDEDKFTTDHLSDNLDTVSYVYKIKTSLDDFFNEKEITLAVPALQGNLLRITDKDGTNASTFMIDSVKLCSVVDTPVNVIATLYLTKM